MKDQKVGHFRKPSKSSRGKRSKNQRGNASVDNSNFLKFDKADVEETAADELIRKSVSQKG